MRVNMLKTKMFAWKDALIEAAPWERVSSFRFLGVPIKEDGTIHWEEVSVKLTTRLKTVAKVAARMASLRARVKCINGYAIAVIYHVHLTDFRALDGKDILIVRRRGDRLDEFDAYFDRTTRTTVNIRGADFHLIDRQSSVSMPQ